MNFDVVAMPADELGRIELAAVFRIERGWHLYWRNPGDSGMAPTVTVKLPPGWSASELRWPAPKRFGDANETTYGYEGDATLFMTLTPPKTSVSGGAPGGAENDAARSSPPRSIDVSSTWMVCKSICLTGGRTRSVALDPPVSQGSVVPNVAAAIERSRAALPQALAPELTTIELAPDDRSGVVRVRLDAAAFGNAGSAAPRLAVDENTAVEFFPFDTPGVSYGAASVEAVDGSIQIVVPFEVNPGNALGQPLRAAGLVRIAPSAGKPTRAFEFVRPLKLDSDRGASRRPGP